MIDVPVEVRRKAASQGAAGERWLRDLPRVVESLERDWDVVAGAALRGGSDAFVAAATTGDGVAAVIKLALPGDWATHQIETLRLAAGRGYARLLAHDEERQAMLLERLGPSLAELGLPVRARSRSSARRCTEGGACRPTRASRAAPRRRARWPSSSPRRGGRWASRAPSA